MELNQDVRCPLCGEPCFFRIDEDGNIKSRCRMNVQFKGPQDFCPYNTDIDLLKRQMGR